MKLFLRYSDSLECFKRGYFLTNLYKLISKKIGNILKCTVSKRLGVSLNFSRMGPCLNSSAMIFFFWVFIISSNCWKTLLTSSRLAARLKLSIETSCSAFVAWINHRNSGFTVSLCIFWIFSIAWRCYLHLKKIFYFQPLQTANFDKGLKPFFYIKRQTKTIISDKNKGINISSN